jgi:hypothetical protein
MKWLSAGLIFVNFATVCGLLLGIICGGLNQSIAIASFILGAAAALAAYFYTADAPADQETPCSGYRSLWLWALAACFVMFAVRSFCWLLYIDGEHLRIQSPNNLGDLALHITYIKNFANGVSLWPDNPIYAFSKLRYPAGIDLFNALLCLQHVDLAQGLIWTGLLASLATFYAFYRWGGAFGVAGFLFNGGIAGFQFLQTLTFLDYQGDKTIAWKSIPLAMFVTQRGLLYAIPAGLLLLWHWREKFFRKSAPDSSRGPLPFWVELSLYASMPLFHLHTFLALNIVLVFLFAFECFSEWKSLVDLVRKVGAIAVRPLNSDTPSWRDVLGNTQIRRHTLVLVTSALVPATFFVWLITDHFQAASVLQWFPGWVLHDRDNDFARPFFLFWIVNFGIWIPLVGLLLGLVAWRSSKMETRSDQDARANLVFLSAALAIFLFAMLEKTAPWEWDNLKVMIWGYFIMLPFLWTQLIQQWSMPIRVAICVALFGSGFVSLFGGLAAGRPGYTFANRVELDAIGVALNALPVEARFAAFPTYNHPLLLQGRKVVLGYPGHLWTQGFDCLGDRQHLTELMEGVDNWRAIARDFGVRYIFWGREEKANYPTSARPWEQTAKKVNYGNWGEIYDLESANQSPAPVTSPR